MASTGRLIFLLAAASGLAAPPQEAGRLLAGLPPRFEPNRGQSAPEVRFQSRLKGYSAEFLAGEVRLRPAGANRTLRMAFEGALAPAAIEGLGRLPSAGHYILGNRPQRWLWGVPHYRALAYRGLYPGVDVVFYGAGDALEYDLRLAPGADPSAVRLHFAGADRLRLTPQGDLEILAGGRRLLQKKPLAFQLEGEQRRPVECRYRLLAGRRVALAPARYDPRRPLIIDPVLVYATYLGAGSNDSIVSVKVDAQGMVYIAGYTGSAELPATPDSVQTAGAGARDIFVAKLDPAREGADALVYFTYLGGSNADTPTAMELDAQGNVYLTGWTQSTDFPLGGNAPQIQRAGDTGQDAFVVKLNPSIAGPVGLLFSTYWGGEGSDTGYGIAVDPQGYIYVAGVTKSEEFPLVGKPIQRGRWGDQDGFVVWMDPNAADPPAAVLYSSYLGGELNDEARAVTALGRGVVAVAGATTSELYHVSGDAFLPKYQGGGDVFLTVLDMNRPEYDGLVYSTYLGGAGAEEPRRIARDPQGRLVLTGYTLSSDFPLAGDAYQPLPRRSGQVFLSLLDPARPGSQGLVYSTYFGAGGGEVAYDVALDDAGRVYLTGYTLSKDFPVTAQAFQKDYGGGVEAFCAVLDPAAPAERALLYSTYLGRTGINVGYGIAVSRDGVIYIAGSVQDRGFPLSQAPLQGAHGGGLADGFLIALKPQETGLGGNPQTTSMQSP